MTIPKISVIIAMFNAEKYIDDALDSLLEQTFRDFEVIVVDDCSTDGSHSIVQSYAEKFGGRLKLFRLPKNSGNNGIPNNRGLALSRGQYVLFMDSDDAVTPDALEKLYDAAKIFDADVVGAERYYEVPDEFWNDKNYRRQPKPVRDFLVSKPTLISADFSERVKDCYNFRFLWNIWSKLIRRDFLIENEISITNEMANDMLLTCFLVFSAERYVLIPDTINFYRLLAGSLTHKTDDPKKYFRRYARALIVGFNHLEKFLSGREFFIQHPDMKNLALEIYVREILNYLIGMYQKFPAHEFDEILRQEFSKNSAALSAYIFSSMNVYMLNFFSARQKIFELEEIIRRDKVTVAALEKINRQDKAYISELEKLAAKLLPEE